MMCVTLRPAGSEPGDDIAVVDNFGALTEGNRLAERNGTTAHRWLARSMAGDRSMNDWRSMIGCCLAGRVSTPSDGCLAARIPYSTPVGWIDHGRPWN